MRLLPALTALAMVAACNDPPRPAIVQDSSAAATTTPATTVGEPPTKSSSGAVPERDVKGSSLKVVNAAQDTDALSQIRTKRLEAKAEGRVLVVYVGATWCEPCKKMKEEIESGRLDARFGKTTFLAFDADKDQDRLGGAGYTFKFVPYVALPGPDGRPAETAEAKGGEGESVG